MINLVNSRFYQHWANGTPISRRIFGVPTVDSELTLPHNFENISYYFIALNILRKGHFWLTGLAKGFQVAGLTLLKEILKHIFSLKLSWPLCAIVHLESRISTNIDGFSSVLSYFFTPLGSKWTDDYTKKSYKSVASLSLKPTARRQKLSWIVDYQILF